MTDEGMNLNDLNNNLNAINDDGILQLTKQDVQPEIDFWDSTVVCYVLRTQSLYSVMNGFLRRVWGKYGIDRVFSCDNGVFLVRFRTRDARERASATRRILFNRKLVITKRWQPDLKIREEKVSVVHVWVKLPNLDLKFWGREALMKIAGLIGKPIKTDKITALKKRIAYARIMIEVAVNGEFPEFIEFFDENGNRIKQAVQFEWKPVECHMCKGMGHVEQDFPNQFVKVRKNQPRQQKSVMNQKRWRPMQKPVQGKAHEHVVKPVHETK
ncbi:uncharacterized protein LOC110697913 [Chenopodium quinoa]|uniref:uncharacterized protein LOC110697913 n=1 Tax=Chenopodium quinoa TaxID=63459 RepID=UPI000B78568D|nr:uncharacterized protein LOC110697913 [Chenopodium quinoa]